MINHIAFPGIGIEFDMDRVAFDIFGKPIYWYAVIIATGFFLAVLYGMHRSRQFGLDDDKISGMLMVATPLAIIGARLYYVLFELDRYIDDPISVFYIWKGGLAIYGGIIGAILGALIYSRFKKIKVVKFMDIGALGLMIGQSIGRWGNFVNVEAYGGETSLPWRMQIAEGMCVHPTFLYESLWNAVGFIALHFYSKKRRFDGEIFLLYVAWYGIGRAMIEGLRTDSLYIPGTPIRVSQLLAGLSTVLAVVILCYNYKKIKENKIGGNTNECSDN